MKDLRQTPQYEKYIRLLGWNVEKLEGSSIFIRKIQPIGSVVKLQRPQKITKGMIKKVDEIAKRHRAFQLSIEPINKTESPMLLSYGYKLSKSPSLCSKTVQIDLKKSEKKLLSEMHHKTRYNIKKGTRNKLKISTSRDIEEFANFWQKCAFDQRRMFLSMKNEIQAIFKAFGKNAQIITAKKDGGLLAAILLIYTNEIAYYMYAASTNEGKKLFAPTLVAWNSIKLAKKLGKQIYDFEGIFDTRFPLPTWKGFSRFKKSFGGNEIEYSGSYVKYRLPF